ncbi:MAG: FtsX-like permease family protein [Actinomycetota bacterium]|nr:FtsX-like permease family protein [Actinomycetota bacterium]
MSAIAAWTRLDLRRRWRSLVVLALLIAVAGGTVMTAFAGAHRGASSLDRLSENTLPLDAMALPNEPHFDWAPFRELDYVVAMTGFALGTGPAVEGIGGESLDFLHVDDEWGRTIERPVVLEGRHYDPEAVDEAVMTPAFAKHYDVEVGDVLTAHLATPEQADLGQDSVPEEEFAGPSIDVTVVGVIRSPWFIDRPGSSGALTISHGMFATYRDNIMGIGGNSSWANALFRLENGSADIPRLRGDLKRIAGREVDVEDFGAGFREIERNLDFEARCLMAFGLAALLAGVVLVGQAIARYAAAEANELRTARALGMTPRQTVLSSVTGPFVSAVVGAGVAIALSIGASRWFPIGSATGIEPAPGLDVDPVILVLGALVVVALATAGAAVSAVLSFRAAAGGPARRSPVATVVSTAGFPVSVVIGTRFALERGLGRASVPVLPALVGAVAGVLGVVAAFSFSHGVDDAIDHPERFGMTYQAVAFGGYNDVELLPLAELGETVRTLDYVTGVDHGRFNTATGPDGQASVDLWSYEPGEKALPTVVIEGRMPESQDEILLSPGSLEDFGMEVGGTIDLTAGQGTRELLVVGSGFVPTGPHNSYNQGGFVTAHGYDALFKNTFKFSLLFVSVEESARGEGLPDRLSADVAAQVPQPAEGGPLFGDPTAEGLDVSSATGQLEQVRVLPVALGIFLALLAIGAVGHAIATATRRRARDLAVLRAGGMTPWQSRGVIATQATVLVVIGLVFGLPLGLAVGRSVWRLVADYTPLEYVPPTAVLVLSLVGPVALLVAYAVAAWPAMRSSGLRIAHVLRAE